MTKIDYNTSEYIVIYAYSLPHVTTHTGHIKVGKANIKLSDYALALDKDKAIEESARKRINEQLGTAQINYNLEISPILGIRDNGSSFMDHDVHAVLKRSGIPCVSLVEGKTRSEWFKTTPETVNNAIEAVKKGCHSLNADQIVADSGGISFYKGSQTVAIERTLKAINAGKKHFLWDAKMRFGKTLTALEVVRQMKYGKTLIITHRPEVGKEWFDAFNALFGGTDYKYGSRDEGERIQTLQNQFLRGANGQIANPFVYFASIQYLRHEVKSAEKLSILNDEWDMVIVDEADEGIKTALADEVLLEIKEKCKFMLMLSGTPFNLLEDYKEDEIFSWDYTAEQELKARWDELYPDEPNPYYKLPKLSIFIYDLNKYIAQDNGDPLFIDLYDKAFNFKEFFRTDEDGTFKHERYVKQFLDLISKESDSNFPYSTPEFRAQLRHTLWMVPGVKEARALEKLLNNHSVFTHFKIANVAGDGNEEMAETKSRNIVKKAITDDPMDAYSITISCGKMTRGVSVPEWSAVFMLSNTSSASTYLQTVFRGQTPWEHDGILKTECFVFDFAPDRTLKVVAEVMNIRKKKPTTSEVKEATGKFLNFCPVISATHGEMKPFSAQKLLHAIKKVAIQKVTRNGFDDPRLYNIENLEHCSDEDLADFAELNKIVGQSKGEQAENKVKMADNGLTKEQYEKAEKAAKKPKRERTPEEEELLRRKREIAEQRKTRISILRGISIRMPMLIFGYKVDKDGHEIKPDDEISLEQFIENVDDESWVEFMPEGVTKDMLREKFAKYYDDEVFIGAGIDIRLRALAADLLPPSERVAEIAEIFKGFKNPDKETVLTPWRVVNMHMSSTLGGSDFNDMIEFDEDKTQKGQQLGLPNWIDQGDVSQIWDDSDAKILEINSKSGLYPLLCAYNFYTRRLPEAIRGGNKTEEDVFRKLWDDIVNRNIFVLCKSPMAVTIAERTLVGYTGAHTNVVYIQDLIKKLKTPSFDFRTTLIQLFREKGVDIVKFDAVVGNPPYQEMNSVNKMSRSIYPQFVEGAVNVGDMVSIVMPARWMSGEDGPYKETSGFVGKMKSFGIKNFTLYPNSQDLFSGVDIKGGICYFTLDPTYQGKTHYSLIEHGKTHETDTSFANKLDDNIIIRYPELTNIVEKIDFGAAGANFKESLASMKTLVSSWNPYGFISDLFVKNNEKVERISEDRQAENDWEIIGLLKGKRVRRFIPYDALKKNHEGAMAYKVLLPRANGSGVFGEVFSTPMLGLPMLIATDTFLQVGQFDNQLEAENLLKYVKTKFYRAMVGVKKTAVFNYKDAFTFVPQQDWSANSDIDWSRSIAEIDQQLYRKYGLDPHEIDFIEARVKAME